MLKVLNLIVTVYRHFGIQGVLNFSVTLKSIHDPGEEGRTWGVNFATKIPFLGGFKIHCFPPKG